MKHNCVFLARSGTQGAVLFNLGASLSQVALAQDRTTADGLLAAGRMFQVRSKNLSLVQALRLAELPALCVALIWEPLIRAEVNTQSRSACSPARGKLLLTLNARMSLQHAGGCGRVCGAA